MNRQQLKEASRHLKKENARYPADMIEIPEENWPFMPAHFTKQEKVFRSSAFIAQLFKEGDSTRISINRTSIDNNGQWVDGITWEELQEIKRQIGFGDRLAVEVYPKDRNIVNVSNMRHLWLIDNLDIGWKK